jgi:pimeloyl-ACP methyl ester carboxylesterase/DNA-binding CsgD family transcriptional regulator
VDPTVSYARTSDGVNIAHTVTGKGPTLILMPGTPFSDFAAEWQIPVLRRAFLGLADRLRIVQYDGRGTGHSQRDVEDVSLDALVRDLEAVVEAVGADRFALFGFYHSVTHAIAYAAREPARVTRMVLFGGGLRGWEPMSGPGTQALLSLIDRDWDTFVESVAHAWLGWPAGEEGRLTADWFRNATTPEVARRVLREATAIDVSAEAHEVRCDALVLHRRDAQVISLDVSERLAAALPGGRLRILEGSSAAIFFERADETIRLLTTFTTRGTADASDGTSAGGTPPETGMAGLTGREVEVLRMLAAGMTNAEIAGGLGLSVNTIERHVGNVYRKIDARGRADATAFAIRRGLA